MRIPPSTYFVSVPIMLTILGCGARGGGFQAEVPELPPLPLGLDAELLRVPKDGPMTPEKVTGDVPEWTERAPPLPPSPSEG